MWNNTTMRIFMSFGKRILCKKEKVIKHFIIPLKIKTLVIFKSSWDMYLMLSLSFMTTSNILESISPHLRLQRIHCEIAERYLKTFLIHWNLVWILNFITLFGALNLKKNSSSWNSYSLETWGKSVDTCTQRPKMCQFITGKGRQTSSTNQGGDS